MTISLAPRPVGGSRFSTRELWLLSLASLWMIFGLQLDSFAHATDPELESFWTPWHAVMYSGIAACGLALAMVLRPRLPANPTWRTLLELPNALRIPITGMGFLLIGGGLDTVWHNLFGIEQGLEILVSWSHIFIILGMVMVSTTPALMIARNTGRHLGGRAGFVALSLVLASIPVHIFAQHIARVCCTIR